MLRSARRKQNTIFGLIQRSYSATAQQPKSGSSLFTKVAFATPPALLAGWYASSEQQKSTLALALHFPVRLGRDIFTAASIVLGRRLKTAATLACHLQPRGANNTDVSSEAVVNTM